MTTTKISLAFVVAIIMTAVVMLAAAGMVAFGRRLRRTAHRSASEADRQFVGSWFIGFGIVIAVFTAGGAAWGFFPYDMQYHQFTRVEGRVESVQPRFLGGNGTTTQQFAIRLAGGGTYRCDDSRCALVKADDTIRLWCIREWQYAATPGWVCRFDDNEPAVPGAMRGRMPRPHESLVDHYLANGGTNPRALAILEEADRSRRARPTATDVRCVSNTQDGARPQ